MAEIGNRALMSMSLVQSALGSSVSASGTSPYTVGTATVTVPSTTVAGNLLILHVASNQHYVTATSQQNPTTTVTAPGISSGSWRQATGGSYGGQVGKHDGGFFNILYFNNAPSISSGSTISIQFDVLSSGLVYTTACQFSFYEFSGISIATPSTIRDVTRSLNDQTSGIPGNGSMTTTVTDLVMCGFAGDSGTCTVGSGYTLSGISMSLTTSTTTTSQLQYKLDVPAGPQATSFSGTSQANYSPGAVGLKGLVITATSSYGFFFG